MCAHKSGQGSQEHLNFLGQLGDTLPVYMYVFFLAAALFRFKVWRVLFSSKLSWAGWLGEVEVEGEVVE